MKFRIIFLLILGSLLTFQACVNGDFDEPPSDAVDPDIKAEQIISLKDVLSKAVQGSFVKIDLDKYVQAVVVADDESGNFYKTIIVEDENSSRGIAVLIDEVELYNFLPVGRRVFIHLKDLWIGDYNGLPQLGYGPYIDNNRQRMSSIPSTIFKDIVIAGAAGIPVVPREVTISQLKDSLLNTLIKIKDIEFVNQGETYADAVTQSTLNRTLSTCSSTEILLRTSGYSDFAGVTVPSGKGTLAAIYSIFGNDQQLMIRDLNDVDMNGPRCGSTAGDEPRMSIQDIKNVYKGSTTTAPKAYIQGVVISDSKYKNITSKNVVIQEGDHGIVVRFSADHAFQLGQEIRIVTTDQEISEFNGLLQLNNIPPAYATLVGAGTLPTPKVLTLKQIADNHPLHESTLVSVKDVEAPGASVYNGNVNIQDGTTSMILRTASTATFANSTVPSGKFNVVAIVSEFTTSGNFTPQLNLRNTTDVTGGTTGGGGGGTGTKMSIQELKSKYSGTKTTAPDGYIQGVVISDLGGKNITAKNLVIQDGNFGIVVRLTTDNTIPLGKEIKIITNGMELSEFNKLLQLNNVPASNVTIVGDGTLPTPKTLTLAQLIADFENLESTLVTINNAGISGAATYAGTLKVNDGTGQMDLFTRSDAAFAGNAVPATPKTITAIVSEFTSGATPGYQLNLRNANDVK
jgi:hypothetical protein